MSENGLFVPERWNKIREILDQRGRVAVDELAVFFGTSKSTIRRDFLEMHRRNMLVRTRGGAVRTEIVPADPQPVASAAIDSDVKKRIGRAAAKLVSPGETVVLDGGSTTYQVALNLQGSNVTLITNSLEAALAVTSRPGVEVLMIGGAVRPRIGAIVGPTAEEQVTQLRPDTAILGMNGVSVTEGLTTRNVFVAQVKRAMIAQSRRMIVVADHTKLGAASFCLVAPLQEADVLVTDEGADPEIVSAISSLGIEVILA